MNVRPIIAREWEEGLKNPMLLATVFIPPLIFTIIPLLAFTNIPINVPPNVQLIEQLTRMGFAKSEILFALVASQFFFMYMLIPAIIPLSIAAYSIIGEKNGKTLEPLLATPLSTAEILIGKSLAAVIPAVAVSWLSYGLLVAEAWFGAGPDIARMFLLQPVWLVAILLLSPALSILSVELGVIISARSSDPRAAQQISVVFVLPLLGLMLASAANKIFVGPGMVAVAAVVILLADAVLMFLGTKAFGRETILTRWK